MARKPTDKQLFKMKNEWLGQFYEEVKPKDFYRAVFPEGTTKLTPQKWGVIFVLQMCKNLLIRLAVKRSKGSILYNISK